MRGRTHWNGWIIIDGPPAPFSGGGLLFFHVVLGAIAIESEASSYREGAGLDASSYLSKIEGADTQFNICLPFCRVA